MNTVGNGHEILNEGERPARIVSREAAQRRIVWQITDVNRPILSGSRLTEDGDDVRFWKKKKGGTITCVKTGKKITFRSKNGVYVLDLWVMDNPAGNSPPPAIRKGEVAKSKAGENKPGFQRQGR